MTAAIRAARLLRPGLRACDRARGRRRRRGPWLVGIECNSQVWVEVEGSKVGIERRSEKVRKLAGSINSIVSCGGNVAAGSSR